MAGLMDFLAEAGMGAMMQSQQPRGFDYLTNFGNQMQNAMGQIGAGMHANADRMTANRMAQAPYDSAMALERMRQEGDTQRQAQKYAILAPLLQSLGGGGQQGGSPSGFGGGGQSQGPLGFTTNYGAGVSFGGGQGGETSRYDWLKNRGITTPGMQTAEQAGMLNPNAAAGQGFVNRTMQQRRAV